MYRLYHYPLCPFSRKIRFLLSYYNISFSLSRENFWERKESFLRLNPAGTVPILVKKNGFVIVHSYVIADYIFAHYHEKGGHLFLRDEKFNLKAREIGMWFDEKFFNEVSKVILYERVVNSFKANEEPDTSALSLARYNFKMHLEYLEFLLSRGAFLAGDGFSIADICAASHISVLDYLGEIRWNFVASSVKDWYSIVKSKLAFKDILLDTIPNIKPSQWYAELDVA